MSKEISGLWVGVTGNTSGLAKSFRSAAAPVQMLGGQLDVVQGKLNSLVSGVFRGIGSAIGQKIFNSVTGGVGRLFDVIKQGIGQGVSLAIDFEQATVAMETMLGSAAAAKTVLQDLTDFAASTPFEMPELINSTKMLIAFGVAQEKLLPTLNAIGDVASGLNIRVEELAELYGKAKVQGRLFAQDINQLVGRGIPIIQEFAKQFGVSESEVKKLVEEGKIGFSQLEKAFADMTGEGGKFAGMMAKQSQTLGGLKSTLMDVIGINLRKFAETLITAFNVKGALTGLIAGLGGVGDVVTGFVAATVPKIIAFGKAIFVGAQAIYGTVAPVVMNVASLIGSAMSSIWSTVTGIWHAIYDFVAPIVAAYAQVITENSQMIFTTMVGYWSSIWGVIKSVWTAILDIAVGIWTAIVGVWDWAVTLITGKTQSSSITIKGAWEMLLGAAKWLMDGVTLTFNVLSWTIDNFATIAEYAFKAVAVEVVTFANQVQYFFGTVIPTVVKWLADNWRDILTTMLNFTNTIFRNIAGNIVTILKNIPNLIKGKVSFAELWTPLTDGFVNTIKALPDIPKREMGELEKSLRKDVDDLGTALGVGLSDHLAAKEKEARDAAKGISDGITKALTPEPTKIEAPKVETPEVPKPPPLKLTADVNPENLAVTITPEIKAAKAIRAGSAEAQALRYLPGLASAIAPKGAAPQPAGPAAKSAPQPGANAAMADFSREVAEKQLAEMKLQTGKLERIATNTAARTTAPVVVNF